MPAWRQQGSVSGGSALAAQRQQDGVSGGRAAAQARQRWVKGGAEAEAGRWHWRQNNKVGSRVREAAMQGGVSSGSVVAVAGRAAVAAVSNNMSALDKDAGTLRKDLDANELSAALKLELRVD
jgi:hypothetical protein